MLGGETVFFQYLLLRVKRHADVEDARFTFSYSPVRVESGEVGGLLINCFETTRQVQARAVQAERDRLFDSLVFKRSRLEYVFQHAPAFLAVLRGPEHVFEIANEAYYRLVGRRDFLGKPALDALPEGRVVVMRHPPSVRPAPGVTVDWKTSFLILVVVSDSRCLACLCIAIWKDDSHRGHRGLGEKQRTRLSSVPSVPSVPSV